MSILPTVTEWGHWLILFTAGYFIKIGYQTVQSDLRKFRKHAITLHDREGHKTSLRHCHEGLCLELRLVGRTGQETLVDSAASDVVSE